FGHLTRVVRRALLPADVRGAVDGDHGLAGQHRRAGIPLHGQAAFGCRVAQRVVQLVAVFANVRPYRLDLAALAGAGGQYVDLVADVRRLVGEPEDSRACVLELRVRLVQPVERDVRAGHRRVHQADSGGRGLRVALVV